MERQTVWDTDDKMLSTNKNKIYNYIPMTIEDENIDHMVRLIRYEPLENFFTRHPSLDEYKDLLRSSQSDSAQETYQDRQPQNNTEAKELKCQENAKLNENDEEEEDDVFYYESDDKEQSVRFHVDRLNVKHIGLYPEKFRHHFDN